ncbi:hypothetical protein [Trichloromonas sp.]|uniref:hypothetical protein n=1 Tax=Trichloromonas sp. TaxID=3069249 RepID=UPI002A3E083F|nr:hypothetical protein [Trichloromonas sp.]
MPNKIYIVTMYRWGRREARIYFLDIWSDYVHTVQAAEDEYRRRHAGKYAAEIVCCENGQVTSVIGISEGSGAAKVPVLDRLASLPAEVITNCPAFSYCVNCTGTAIELLETLTKRNLMVGFRSFPSLLTGENLLAGECYWFDIHSADRTWYALGTTIAQKVYGTVSRINAHAV